MEIVDGTAYINEIKALIIEYAQALGRDLCFQAFDEELSNLGKKYTGQSGCLLALLVDGKVRGCVAFRRLSATSCEMKRLYVQPDVRGMKAGEKLVERIIQRAQEAGYTEMLLDTIRPLQAAIHLYKKFGFEECGAYYDNPMDDVIYMRKQLA